MDATPETPSHDGLPGNEQPDGMVSVGDLAGLIRETLNGARELLRATQDTVLGLRQDLDGVAEGLDNLDARLGNLSAEFRAFTEDILHQRAANNARFERIETKITGGDIAV